MTGMTTSVRIVDETIPPTIGAAMRFITWEPVPCPHKMGNRPAMMAMTVIILGRTRSTAPTMMASYRSFNEVICPRKSLSL